MKKEGLIACIFVLTLINLSCLVFAEEEFTLNSPDRASNSEEFEIEIKALSLSEKEYDVKTWIELSENGTVISDRYDEINSEWKSGIYYVNGFFKGPGDKTKKIKLRIRDSYKNFEGKAELFFRTRNGHSLNKSIEIVKAGENNNNNDSDNNINGDNNNNSVSIEMNWDEDEIINGEDFEIEIQWEDLEDEDYDIKIWIESEDDEKIISDRYDKENNEWKSGTYYVNGFIEGPGDETQTILLRIREDYNDYEGDARLYCKIRGGNKVFEEHSDIEILLNEDSENSDDSSEDNSDDSSDSSDNSDNNGQKKDETYEEYINRMSKEWGSQISKLRNSTTSGYAITGNAIRLGGSDKDNKIINEKNASGNIIYESKSELIKKYSVYGFAFLLAMLCVLLAFDRLK